MSSARIEGKIRRRAARNESVGFVTQNAPATIYRRSPEASVGFRYRIDSKPLAAEGPGCARYDWRLHQRGLTRLLLFAAGVVLANVVPAVAQQQLNQLSCQGQIYGLQAIIVGQRLYSPYNALGDGEVAFNGQIQAGNITGTIQYGGYTTGAFDGFIQSSAGAVRISVLDNTGGRMIIYEGGASLGAPNEIGNFVCNWQ